MHKLLVNTSTSLDITSGMYKHLPTCVCDQKTYFLSKLYIFMSQNIFTKVIFHKLKKCFIKKMFFKFQIMNRHVPAQNRQENFTR